MSTLAPKFRQYGCWPLPDQLLLLKAALLDGDAAVSAWTSWEVNQRAITPGTTSIDLGSRRLLPLVRHNLTRIGATVRGLGIADEMADKQRVRQTRIVECAADVARSFRVASIPTMVLKGLPLGLLYYDHALLRPMMDVDLVIPARQALAAYAAITAAGWTAQDDPPEWPPRFSASRSFSNSGDIELDLHYHVLHESWRDDADDELWADAIPVVVGRESTLALAPADQLLHVLVHGMRRSRMPPMRWVADAAMVMRSPAPRHIDWDAFVRHARQLRVHRLVAETLRYLDEALGIAAPQDVTAALQATPTTLAERLEPWARAEPGGLRLAVATRCDFARARGRDRDWSGPFGFVRYVRDRLRTPSLLSVPAVAATNIGKRLRGLPTRDIGN